MTCDNWCMRVHTLVNPFNVQWSLLPPRWEHIFADPTLPVGLDIGVGQGNFILAMAQHHPRMNFIGVDIRKKLVYGINEKIKKLKLPNVHIYYCNIVHSLYPLFKDHLINEVYIFFPDPYIEKQHMIKRRLIDDSFIQNLTQYMAPDSKLFVQTDVKVLAEHIRQMCRQCSALTHASDDWIDETTWRSIFPVQLSNREKDAQKDGMPVYRIICTRGQK